MPAEPQIRRATPADVARIQEIIIEAYSPYIARIGRKPGPMTEDYASIVARGDIHVIEMGQVDGVIVLSWKSDALMIENVAVSSDARGQGFGARLMRFAEDQARQRGQMRLTLYTHEKMVENLGIYARAGYLETHRATQDGFPRVFLEKRLS